MAKVHTHSSFLSYLDAICEIDQNALTDPHLFELHDDDLRPRGAFAADVVQWVSRHLLHGDCHYLAPEFPLLGERHQFFFEDILDGERFRKAWGYLDWGRLCPGEIAALARDRARPHRRP